MRNLFHRLQPSESDAIEAEADALNDKLSNETDALKFSPERYTLGGLSTSVLALIESTDSLLQTESLHNTSDDALSQYLDLLATAREKVKALDIEAQVDSTVDETKSVISLASVPETLETLLSLRRILEQFMVQDPPHDFRLLKTGDDPSRKILDRASMPAARDPRDELVARLTSWIEKSAASDDAAVEDTVTIFSSSTLSEPDTISDGFPLRSALASSQLGTPKNYPLKRFMAWATGQTVQPNPGWLQSAHLHRERGYLHHEYILLCFRDPNGSESWLRAERAARFKRHHLQGDSFGPIIGGATLRETITIAGDSASLTSGDEIAKITLIADLSYGLAGGRQSIMSFKNGLDLLTWNSDASHKYRLLSENCRWFARRSMLSLLEILAGPTAKAAALYWRGELVLADALDSHLRAEWAGGGNQLKGWKNLIINAAHLRRLARSCVVLRKFDQSLELCHSALEHLELAATSAPPSVYVERVNLQASVNLTISEALIHLGRTEEAIAACETAISLTSNPSFSNAYTPIIAQEQLATLQMDRGEYAEALQIQFPLVERVRGFLKGEEQDTHARVLARILVNTGLCQFRLSAADGTPLDTSTFVLLAESISLSRELYAKHPDEYRFTLADTLRIQAVVLNAVQENEKALKSSREFISLFRKIRPDAAATALTFIDAANPVEISPTLFPEALLNHMKFAVDAGQYDEAIGAGRECVDLLRAFLDSEAASSEPPHIVQEARTRLGEAMYYTGVHMRTAGKVMSTIIPLWREALEVVRLLESQAPGSHSESLARVFFNLGLETKDIALLAECVSISRDIFEVQRNTSSRMELIIRLSEYAELASAKGDWEVSCTAEEEMIEHTKLLAPNEPDKHRPDLAGFASNLGRHQYLAGRPEKALEAFQLAAYEWKILFHGNRSSFGASYARAAQSLKAAGDALLAKDPSNRERAMDAFAGALSITEDIGTSEDEGIRKLRSVIDELKTTAAAGAPAEADALQAKLSDDSNPLEFSSETYNLGGLSTSVLALFESAEALLSKEPPDESNELLSQCLDLLAAAREKVKVINIQALSESSEDANTHVASLASALEPLESLLSIQRILEQFIGKVQPHRARASLQAQDDPSTRTPIEGSSSTTRDPRGDLITRLTDWIGIKPTETNEAEGEDTVMVLSSATVGENPTTNDDFPLKRALAASRLGTPKNYPLKRFMGWSTSEAVQPNPGWLQSAHLHRESGYLHHEYILLCFRDPNGSESWLRAERAARFKRHHLQGDSFGPIVGGATLRETISVASNADDLTTGVEIGKIVVTTDGSSGSTGGGSPIVSFKNGLDVLRWNANASDKYRLLSENCRWFARRSMLSLLEVFAGPTAQTVALYWRDKPVLADALETHLRAEWAGGGSQLKGWKNHLINAAHLRRFARSLSVLRKFGQSLELCRSALDVLKLAAASAPPSINVERITLEVLVDLTMSETLIQLGRADDAITACETAILLTGDPAFAGTYMPIIAREQFTILLMERGELAKALQIQLPLIKRVRGVLQDDYQDTHVRVLARILLNTGICQYRLSLADGTAVDSTIFGLFAESLSLSRELYAKYPDEYRYSLADTLRYQATVFNAAKNNEQALKCSREFRSLFQEIRHHTPAATLTLVDAAYPIEISPTLLPDALMNHMTFAMEVQQYDEAIDAGKECASTLRTFLTSEAASSEPSRIVQYAKKLLGDALYYTGINMRTAGTGMDVIIPLWREALEVNRLLVAHAPKVHSESLARVLYVLGAETKDISMLTECVSLSRDIFEVQHDTNSRSELIIRLDQYVELVTEKQDWDAACAAGEEMIEHTKLLAPNEPQKHRRDLAGFTSNLGRYQYLAGRLEKALEAYNAAAQEWKTLFHIDPSSFLQPYALAAQSFSVVGNAFMSKQPPDTDRGMEAFSGMLSILEDIGKPEDEGRRQLRNAIDEWKATKVQ